MFGTHAKVYPLVPSLAKSLFKRLTSAVGGAAKAAATKSAKTMKDFILRVDFGRSGLWSEEISKQSDGVK
jgi:hypothetical protein